VHRSEPRQGHWNDKASRGSDGQHNSVTSYDVARLAGVSQPTVSRALRGSTDVSAETQRRVLDAVDKLGYVTMESGRSLATRRTGRVGIVAGELSNPYFASLVQPLHRALARHGYGTMILPDENESDFDSGALRDGSVDGVLLTTSVLGSPTPAELVRRRVPFVLVGREVAGSEDYACVFDNYGGAKDVANLLLDHGHERLGMILGPSETSTARDREAGFREAVAERGARLPSPAVARGEFTVEHGYESLRTLMRLTTPPTGVFCANDVIAVGALNAAHKLGISVPEGLTIVGFDDISMSAWEVFRLTTVRLDFEAMAEEACRLLVERMTTSSPSIGRKVIPVSLSLRGTHAPRRGAGTRSHKA
jgi:LacI family transcriptional regulator